MRIANDSAAPLFRQLANDLRQRIIDRSLAAGTKLPSEQELAQTHGVSLITVRQALSRLHGERLIQKINGKGSFVTEPEDAPDLGPMRGFYEHMRFKGHTVRGKLLSVRTMPAPEAAAHALGVPTGSALRGFNLLRLVDDKPFCVGMTLGTPDFIRRLLDEDVESNDSMSLLESRLGYRLKALQSETCAVRAGAERARRLHTRADAPLLRIRFVPIDIGGNALSFSEIFFLGEQFNYKTMASR